MEQAFNRIAKDALAMQNKWSGMQTLFQKMPIEKHYILYLKKKECCSVMWQSHNVSLYIYFV